MEPDLATVRAIYCPKPYFRNPSLPRVIDRQYKTDIRNTGITG